MDESKFIVIDFTPGNRERLLKLVRHREDILEQLQGNFGNISQHPCYVDALGDLKGFQILVPDVYINDDADRTITLKFDRNQYSFGIKVAKDVKTPYHVWMYWQKNQTLCRSRAFIETVYRFLNNFNRIQPKEEGERINSDDIRKYWDKLVNAIPQSI